MRLTWPADGPISQKFGENPDLYRPHGLDGHEGVDVVVPVGTPLRAPHSGEAMVAKSENYGGYVLIRADGYETWTAHLSEVQVRHEQQVERGEIIGLSSNTGRSTGPHYHLSLRPLPRDMDNGYKGCVDPLPYLREEEEEPMNVYVQCQGHGYDDWVVEHAKALGGVQLLNPQDGEYQKFVRAGVPLIGRLIHANDADKSLVYEGASGAEDWWRYWFWPTAQRCPEIDVWRGPNEPTTNNEEHARALDAFTARLCDLFYAHEKRLVGINWSTGHPELGMWKHMGRSLQRLIETEGYLGRHAYSVERPFFDPDDTWHAFRLERDVAAIRDAGHPVPPIVLGETGIDKGGGPTTDGWRARGVSAEEYVEGLWTYMTRLKKRVPEVVIASPFVWLSTGWPSFDIGHVESEMLIARRPHPGRLLPSAESAEDVATLTEKARYWLEEYVRQREGGDREYADAILYDLIDPENGLLYRAERAAKDV